MGRACDWWAGLQVGGAGLRLVGEAAGGRGRARHAGWRGWGRGERGKVL